ncbi:glycosyltransferase family 2 protein [Oleidesulfovibrio sp.]|uniref:glycosyltransferase family 2 protein n=1 Tax=Oleidesulfovibrio sp. TaxID=2909707 RepID=UPI003A8A6F7A
MKTAPAISVIIPVYNYAHMLSQALDSVKAQTWNDYEVIVVDDGSTDNTADVVSGYGDSVRYIYKQRGGAASARNEGIRQATAGIVAFLDADDEWVPEKLAVQMAFWEANPQYDMIYCDMQHVVRGEKVHHSYLHERDYKYFGSGWKYTDLLHESFVFTPSVLVRKHCFDVVGLHDETLLTCQDLDMWLRIARSFQLGFVDEPLVIRHEHGHNNTLNAERFHLNQIKVFLRNEAESADEEVLAVLHSRLYMQYFGLGYFYFGQMRMTECRTAMQQAIHYGGFRRQALKYYVLSLIPKFALRILGRATGRGPCA